MIILIFVIKSNASNVLKMHFLSTLIVKGSIFQFNKLMIIWLHDSKFDPVSQCICLKCTHTAVYCLAPTEDQNHNYGF